MKSLFSVLILKSFESSHCIKSLACRIFFVLLSFFSFSIRFRHCLCSHETERCSFSSESDDSKQGFYKNVGPIERQQLKRSSKDISDIDVMATTFVCQERYYGQTVNCTREKSENQSWIDLENSTMFKIDCGATCVNGVWENRADVHYQGSVLDNNDTLNEGRCDDITESETGVSVETQHLQTAPSATTTEVPWLTLISTMLPEVNEDSKNPKQGFVIVLVAGMGAGLALVIIVAVSIVFICRRVRNKRQAGSEDLRLRQSNLYLEAPSDPHKEPVSVSDKLRIIEITDNGKPLYDAGFENTGHLCKASEEDGDDVYMNYEECSKLSGNSHQRDSFTACGVYSNTKVCGQSASGNVDIGLRAFPAEPSLDNLCKLDQDNVYGNVQSQDKPTSDQLREISDCECVAVDDLVELRKGAAKKSAEPDVASEHRVSEHSSGLGHPKAARDKEGQCGVGNTPIGRDCRNSRLISGQAGMPTAIASTLDQSHSFDSEELRAFPRRKKQAPLSAEKPRIFLSQSDEVKQLKSQSEAKERGGEVVYSRFSTGKDWRPAEIEGTIDETYNRASGDFRQFLEEKRQRLLNAEQHDRHSSLCREDSQNVYDQAGEITDEIYQNDADNKFEGHNRLSFSAEIEQKEREESNESGDALYFDLEDVGEMESRGDNIYSNCVGSQYQAQEEDPPSELYFQLEPEEENC